MQIQVPPGMSPDMAVQMLQKRLETYAKNMRQAACVNAVITIKGATYSMHSMEVDPGDLIFSDKHCKNQRRNGSKYCQPCSDKHNGIETKKGKV